MPSANDRGLRPKICVRRDQTGINPKVVAILLFTAANWNDLVG